MPSHAKFTLLELLKNSARAVVEHHHPAFGASAASGDAADYARRAAAAASAPAVPLPAIRVVLAAGSEDITIKVADEGGGFKRSSLEHHRSWFATTAPPPSADETDGGDSGGGTGQAPPLCGYGIGLPLARVHARYFGGDLELRGLEGHGVDAYLHLNRLGADCENLPALVRASPAGRDSTLSASRSPA